MEIVKQLRISVGGTLPNEANGVLIDDSGFTYPVLKEALVNTVIFPQLISSGYKLIGYPYSFEKSGTFSDKLPIEDYTPKDAKEEEHIYTSVGAKYNNGDLSKYYSVPTTSTLDRPDVNYSILDRNEFLKYLDNYDILPSEFDFRPINYFVAPNALFTLKEYFSEEYAKYRRILEDRRTMSQFRFIQLLEFLKKFGLPVNPTPFEIVKTYFSWGIDGLRWTATSSIEVDSDYPVRAYYLKYDNFYATEEIKGLIDNKGSKLIPMSRRRENWQLTDISKSQWIYMTTPDAQGHIALKDGDTMVTTFTHRIKTKYMEVECGYRILYDEYIVYIEGCPALPTINVKSNIAGELISLKQALPTNESQREYYKDQYLHAIAEYILDKRRVPCNVSSYDLLQRFSINAPSCIKYIALMAGYMPIEGSSSDDYVNINARDDSIYLHPMDVDKYCSGEWEEYSKMYQPLVAENKLNTIQGIIDGTINCDYIAKGIMDDANTSSESLYDEVKIIHEILGVDLNTIYEQIKETPKGKTVTFTGNNLTRTVSLTPLDNHKKSIKRNNNYYAKKAAKEKATEVTNAAVDAAKQAIDDAAEAAKKQIDKK